MNTFPLLAPNVTLHFEIIKQFLKQEKKLNTTDFAQVSVVS